VFGEGCTECSADNCTKCDENNDFYNVNGVCVKFDEDGCKIAYGEGCSVCNATGCSDKYEGYFLSEKRAVNCDVLPSNPSTLREQCKGKLARFVAAPVRRGDDVCDAGKNVTVSFNSNQYCADCMDVIPNCSTCSIKEEMIVCDECAPGYVLFGGVCKACSELHGEACSECSISSCKNVICEDNHIQVSGKCFECDDLYSQCSKCSAEKCTACEEGLIPDNDGNCVSCQSKYGAGCTTCDASKCNDCTSEQCIKCEEGKQHIIKNNKIICDTCEALSKNCKNCTSAKCVECKDNYVLESGECKTCSELFEKCGECTADKCTKCSLDGWFVTDNGCYKPDEPSHQSSSKSPSSKAQSSHASSGKKPVTPSSSAPKSSKAGMIAGIVVGVVVAAAIIIIVVYCVVTSGSKHAKVDPGIYEEDPEFVSMSVL